MKRIILSITILLLQIHAVSLHAQGIAKNYKADNNNNPISASVFCADPTALDYNGRLYVYGSNDHQQFIKNNKKDGNGYGDIKSLVVLSTDDMVNWTFHGTIDVQKICSTWKVAGGQWYKGFMNSWAPSVTWRATEDGKEEFFLYFANTSHGVGVLKADSPVGPWTSPLNHSMINRDTPGVLPCSWIFDPGVVIDENGTGWISFGGGDPNEQGTTLQPNNALFAKLDASMTALDGKPARIPAPYHFEASELNIMNGKFVYTYCSSWAERTDADWNAYKQEHNLKIGKPNTCTMCYMVSDDPMNPDSWEYKGVCGKHPGFPSPNNHSHLHKFQGNYYYLYHWAPLMKSMLDGKAIDSSCDGYRSICVNLATVDEGTQKINSVNQNLTGVTAIKNLNPYDLQQAETTANSGGVPILTYTVPADVTKQLDILTAKHIGVDKGDDVQLPFDHVMSAIKFNFKHGSTPDGTPADGGTPKDNFRWSDGLTTYDVKVTNIQITGVYKKGTWQVGENPYGGARWTIDTSAGTGDFSYSPAKTLTGESSPVDLNPDDAGNVFMMLPQQVPAGAKVLLTCELTPVGESTATKNMSLAVNLLETDGTTPKTWLPGFTYTYTMSLSDFVYVFDYNVATAKNYGTSGSAVAYAGTTEEGVFIEPDLTVIYLDSVPEGDYVVTLTFGPSDIDDMIDISVTGCSFSEQFVPDHQSDNIVQIPISLHRDEGSEDNLVTIRITSGYHEDILLKEVVLDEA